jgi:hypothetical protein
LRVNRIKPVSGLLFELDARSYSSGQTFANSWPTPYDGSAQTAYDYFLGATSSSEATDPTFNSAGAASYFSHDGGDYFTCTSGSGSTSFLKNLHKAAGKFSVELWFYYNGNAAQSSWFDSGTSDQGGTDMSRGVIYTCSDTTFSGLGQQLRVKRDSAAANALSVTTLSAFSTGVHMAGLSYEAGASSFFYRDGAYDPTSSGNTFTATLSTPGTTDAANSSKIGARGDGANRVPNGSRLYRIALYNKALSKADFDELWLLHRGRFGL